MYAAGRVWGASLQPSDQIPSPVDWGWNYFKGKQPTVDYKDSNQVILLKIQWMVFTVFIKDNIDK